MDPFAVLGVSPDSPPDVLAAAYRRAAKRWHPDRGGGSHAARRMAEINAAYDLLRDGGWRSAQAAAATVAASDRPRRRARGSWLSDAVRQALGGELVAALRDGEQVRIVTPAATWASPSTVLAVTDSRLLWLQDDAIAHRVQSVPFAAIADVRLAKRRFRRHVAVIRLQTLNGRRHTFAELRPSIAEDIVRRIPARGSRAA
jgi:curved DNA-binding protein CbpA